MFENIVWQMCRWMSVVKYKYVSGLKPHKFLFVSTSNSRTKPPHSFAPNTVILDSCIFVDHVQQTASLDLVLFVPGFDFKDDQRPYFPWLLRYHTNLCQTQLTNPHQIETPRTSPGAVLPCIVASWTGC